ncbi:S-adenosyl-L-methionine-dependent methyltransferase [Trichoderma evansii]
MAYFMVDTSVQTEKDRLNHQHNIVMRLLGDRLGKAPVHSPAQVLDLATGTGIWAIQYAEQHPESTVLGVDLNITEPQGLIPGNCRFLQFDAESDEWPLAHSFDYVHFGHVVTCFDDTKAVMRKAFDHMKPGGWIEFHDPEVRHTADDDSAKGTAIEKWVEMAVKGASNVGRDLQKPARYQTWLSETGFVNVREDRFSLPSNEWPEDTKLKQFGAMYKHNLLWLTESLARFLSLAGLSNMEAEDLKERAKRDIQNPQIHITFPYHIVYAQKPLNAHI